MSQTFAEVVEQAHELDPVAKQELFDLLRHWLVEDRRVEIARLRAQAHEDFAAGRTRSGRLDDLMADLDAED